MICGLCKGEVRGYAGVLYGRPIKDWKHRSVPPGTKPHRPVLGTPVDQATLDRAYRPRVDPEPVVAGAVDTTPRVLPRAATDAELASSRSATQLLRLLEDYCWAPLEQPQYFQAADGIEFLVLRARRRDLGVVVSWRRRPQKGAWELEFAYRIADGLTGPVGSEQLKQWISQRDERCPDCGRSSVVHGEECP